MCTNIMRESLFNRQANEKAKHMKDLSLCTYFSLSSSEQDLMLGSAALSEEEQIWWTNQYRISPEATDPVQTLDCSSFLCGRETHNHPQLISTRETQTVLSASSDRCRLCICASKFMLAVIPSSFQFRQCLEQGSCIKFLPHAVPCLGSILRNHKIKG